jgi:hypothetical protein
VPLDRVQDLASTPAVTIEMAAAARPALRHLRAGNPQVSSLPMRGLVGSHDEPRSALADGADVGWVRLCGRGPLAPLLVSAPQRRFGNEKGHGVLDVASGPDTKSHHRTTIGSQDAAESDSLLSARERLSDTTGRCGAYVGRILQGAKPGELLRQKQPPRIIRPPIPSLAGCGGPQPPAGEQIAGVPDRGHRLKPVSQA